MLLKFIFSLAFASNVIALRQSMSLNNVTAQTHDDTGIALCDALLAAGLGEKLLFPSSTAFEESIASYWQSNARLRSWCILQPNNTHDVSIAMAALSGGREETAEGGVAIKSGGHSTASLASGITNGVTIDLGMLNRTIHQKLKSVASIEPGARWKDVYATLSPDNVTVAGGRDGDVGVGGLLLGGGISYYAAQTGFSADSVINFEVVLASGKVVNANEQHNPDLWKALKGGTNNFGIVTRFDVTTITGQAVAYSERSIDINDSDSFIDALVHFTDNNSQNPDDAVIGFYTHEPANLGVSIILIEINVSGRANSSGFDEFNRIPSHISVDTTLSLAEVADRSQYAGGQRNVGSTLTFKNDARIVRRVVELHDQLVSYLSDRIGASSFVTTCFFEPICSAVQDAGQLKGGNMLGLPRGQNVVIWDAGIQVLSNDSDLAVAHAALRRLSAQVTEVARTLDGLVALQYANYADASQEVIESYSSENVLFMQDVARRYDPHGFFQTRVSGGFKLPRRKQ